jgi:hypothetical protein
MSGSGTGTPVAASAETTLGDMIAEVQTRLGDAGGTVYSDEVVRLMLNSALAFLFPKFYVLEAQQLTANGEKVFALDPDLGEEVAAVVDVYELGS